MFSVLAPGTIPGGGGPFAPGTGGLAHPHIRKDCPGTCGSCNSNFHGYLLLGEGLCDAQGVRDTDFYRVTYGVRDCFEKCDLQPACTGVDFKEDERICNLYYTMAISASGKASIRCRRRVSTDMGMGGPSIWSRQTAP